MLFLGTILMRSECSNDRFLLRTKITLTKAIFSNLELLQYLERDVGMRVADEHAETLCSRLADRDELTNVYVTGRFLRFRKLNPNLTDEALEHRIHFCVDDIEQNCFEHRHCEIDNPANCLMPLLTRLAKAFLVEASDGSLRIRSCYLAEWQDLILVVPPMLITAAWMLDQQGRSDETISGRKEFQRRVQAWLCDSTMPVDDDPFLDHLCKTEGLDETHMHLNGTTEAEKVWFDALRKTSTVIGAIKKVKKNESGLHAKIGNGINRLLQQEDTALTPELLRTRVEQAATLKAYLLENLCSAEKTVFAKDLSPGERYAAAVRSWPLEGDVSTTTAEALQLVDIMAALTYGDKCKSDTYGIAFLWYALIRAQFCRLLVQQVEQVGFDQFQYITLNELRETTEKNYAERFRQIERGVQQPVDFLEGRFAPKKTPADTAQLLIRILRGYLQFLDEQADSRPRKHLKKIYSDPAHHPLSLVETLKLVRAFEDGETDTSGARIPRSQRRLRLGLVVHFIKKSDSEQRERFTAKNELMPVCRDSKVRREVDRAARALVVLMNQTTGLAQLIRGVDAASNERHAGPEVFAQVFRRMRHAGIKRFTYHAGEDFVHLASGLRAINEAVLFLDLSAGCRIGHGTAAGLVPEKWWSSIGGSVIQPSEDRLDDLVFAWKTLAQHGVLLDKLPLIEMEIRSLAMQIWEDPSLTPDLLWRAWRLRHIDPIVRTYGNYDVDRIRDAEIKLFLNSQRSDEAAHKQFLRRHGVGASRETFKRCSKSVVVSRETDVLDEQVLEELQKATLKLVQERRIAIETLPSSNVRISVHQSYEDHHSTGWLGFGRNLGHTSIVVGSDDPGIFATSLRMEYAHLLRALEANGAGAEAMTMLERVNKTAKRFRF